ncbi:MAG: type IV secretion system protein [Lysobacter sp.]|nr:MAG: type IV secretion system protein [Lysobacter sp.]
MKSRQATTDRIAHSVGRAANYEVTIADLARRSERRAWRVTGAAIAMSLILAGGMFYMLPLKEKVPYLVMADAYSGTATMARLTGDFGKTSIALSEAVNRSNVAHYVQAREAYDLALMNLRDWTVVYTMSAPEVATGYTSANSSQNPDSPFNVYGRDKAIRVQINSIQMLGGSATTPPKGATVRFQRSLYDRTNGYSDFLDNRIATLEFTYKSNLRMDEKQRIENPLGFRVTSYRVDTDFASTPPPAVARTTSGSAAQVDMLPAPMQTTTTFPGAAPAPVGASATSATGATAASEGAAPR